MRLTPEYRKLIAQEVSMRQSPAEQRELIRKQNATVDAVRTPYLPVNARLHALSQAMLKPSE
jgi:hypothetical protein